MFPTAGARRPACSSIALTSVVTVDLPFVPLTTTTGTVAASTARSRSPRTATPAARAATIAGWSGRTPGARHQQIRTGEHAVPVDRAFQHLLAGLLRGGAPRRVLGLARALLHDDDVVTTGTQPSRHDGTGRTQPDHHDPHYSMIPGMRRKSA